MLTPRRRGYARSAVRPRGTSRKGGDLRKLTAVLVIATVTAGLAASAGHGAGRPVAYPVRYGLALKINRYLARTPMRSSGFALAWAGCRHGVDPRLLVAIAGAESTFGRGSHPSLNVWGNGPGNYMGPTWLQAAEQEARLLDGRYFARGLDTVYEIQPVFVGYPSQRWTEVVEGVLRNLGASPQWLRVRC